ncbi:response regulator transcription factor [Nocardioides pyridinolyticus]
MHGHHLLVVDDHPVLAESLAHVLAGRAEYATVVVAHSLADARTELGRSAFDRAVVDVRLPDGDGTSLVPQLVDQPGGCRVVVLTAHPHPHVVARATSGGAASVLPKGSSLTVLLDALEGRLPPATTGDAADVPSRLSRREIEVLTLLADGQDVRQAARRLEISHHTVRDHLKSTYVKLGASSQLEAVLTAHREGLIDVDGGHHP